MTRRKGIITAFFFTFAVGLLTLPSYGGDRIQSSDRRDPFIPLIPEELEEIKKEIEKEFKVEVENINSQIVKGKKVAFIKLKSKYVASDIATKLGML